MIQKSRKNIVNNNQAFTLIETLVAVGLFSVVIMISVSTLMTILSASTKAQNIKTSVNNVNFAVETISSALMTARNSSIGCLNSSGADTDCSNAGNSGIVFDRKIEGNKIKKYKIYYSDDDRELKMETIKGAETTLSTLMPSGIDVNNKNNIFHVDKDSKRVEIILSVTVGNGKGESLTNFNIQTGIKELGILD